MRCGFAASFRRAVPQTTESPKIISHANFGRFPSPAGQSCASAQIWPAVTGERGRQTNVENKAWGSKGQSPSRIFAYFLFAKKVGARRGRSDLRPACGGSQTELQFCGSCEPENQSSAAGCYPENQSSAAKCGKEATKKKSKQNDRKKKREKSGKRRKTGEMTGKIA